MSSANMIGLSVRVKQLYAVISAVNTYNRKLMPTRLHYCPCSGNNFPMSVGHRTEKDIPSLPAAATDVVSASGWMEEY